MRTGSSANGRQWRRGVVIALLGAACARDNPRFDASAIAASASDGQTDVDEDGEGEDDDADNDAEDDADNDAEDDAEDGPICVPRDASCRPLEAACCEGLKCTPLDTGTGMFDAPECRPIDPGASDIGDACDAGPLGDGCVPQALCLGGLSGVGVCTPFCNDDSSCEGFCAATPGFTEWGLCVPECEALTDCPSGWGCYPTGQGILVCAPAGQLAVFDPCRGLNECAPGLACVAIDGAEAACEDGCCYALCDPGDATCDGGLQCAAFEANEDLGVCI